MRKTHLLSSLFISLALLSGCSSDDNPLSAGGAAGTARGIVSQKNFSVLTADINPGVIDGTTGAFTKTDVEITVYVGDRNNQLLGDPHTVYFVSEYGLIEPSCVTKDGTCSVTWSAITYPVSGGPASDGFVTITAYTIGEEGFIDSNGNSTFDDGESFTDIEEPYVDADWRWELPLAGGFYNAGDLVIDVVSLNDPTGKNGVHDIADGFFNGSGCTHSSLCGTARTITIFADTGMNIVTDAPLNRSISGNVSGLLGTGLTLQNNAADDLSITANGPYTFPGFVLDGDTYAVTVSVQPTGPNQTCTVANGTGTVSANVTNANVTCATTTYTVGGTVTGIPGGETLIIQNNGGDDLSITADGSFVFATPIADSSAYTVTINTNPASATCTISGGTGTGTVSGANVTNVTIGCI